MYPTEQGEMYSSTLGYVCAGGRRVGMEENTGWAKQTRCVRRDYRDVFFFDALILQAPFLCTIYCQKIHRRLAVYSLFSGLGMSRQFPSACLSHAGKLFVSSRPHILFSILVLDLPTLLTLGSLSLSFLPGFQLSLDDVLKHDGC
ncbi:hypothetical protein VTO42DRAFT_1691 [Malbranchea cinnamomea]